MYRKLLFVSLVLCLMVFGGTTLAFAGQIDGETPTPTLIEKMKREGWLQIAEGVLQRTRGEGSRVETLAYGPEGFQWLEQDLLGQLERMQAEHQAYPSRKLARIIEKQKKEILRIQAALRNNEIPTFDEKAVVNGCDVTYGAHADVSARTDVQGITANAEAYFSNNCYAPGHTEAYIFVRATLNGTTTTHSIFDPKDTYSGGYIRSIANWSLQGQGCYGEASARVDSVQLALSYSVNDYIYDCPPPPLKVTISGPISTSITGYNCTTLNWTATATGGIPGYSYAWYNGGYYVGSGSSYSEFFCGDNIAWTQTVNLSVTATDSVGATASDTHVTKIYYYRSTTCDPYALKAAGLPYCPEEPY